MSTDRIFPSHAHLQPHDTEPIRSVITQSADATVVAWYVKPDQRIATHVHPQGQDTWTVLSGNGEYVVGADGASRPLVAGDVAVARTGEAHGVHNTGTVPLVFISVVCPLEAGYELL